jgi:Flagellar hook-length control protein FliK
MSQAELLAIVSSAVLAPGASPGPAGDPFRAALRLGEIIEGRVTRSLGSARYAVDFSGSERVVDSVIPLRTGEILYGRVVAIGDRVELQRVRTEIPRDRAATAEPVTRESGATPSGMPSTFPGAAGRWSADEMKAAARIVEEAADPPRMRLGASAVAKLGLPFSRELIGRLYSSLSRPGRGALPLRSDAIVVETSKMGQRAERTSETNAPALAALAESLRAQFELARETLVRGGERGRSGGNESERRRRAADEEPAGETELGIFFNAQLEGAMSHAIVTVPLIVDGRLIELDVALFQQKGHGGDGGTLSHGKVVISLATENLGRVQIRATLVGEHVHLNLASDVPGAADYMATHAPVLRSELEGHGWIVDGIRYQLDPTGGVGGAAQAVLEYFDSGESFSRLV